MKSTLRGRLRLDIRLERILHAIRSHRQIVAAARELGCSQAYIHARLKKAGLTLREVLEADAAVDLLRLQIGDTDRAKPRSADEIVADLNQMVEPLARLGLPGGCQRQSVVANAVDVSDKTDDHPLLVDLLAGPMGVPV